MRRGTTCVGHFLCRCAGASDTRQPAALLVDMKAGGTTPRPAHQERTTMVSQHPHLLAQEAYQRGTEHLRRNQRREAQADFEEAVGFDPDLAEAHLELGKLLLPRDPARAVGPFGEVVRLWPDRPEGYALRGAALAQSERPDEGLADLDRALALQPNLPQALHDRGVILARSNRHREAEEQFTRALEHDPHTAGTWFDRGCVLLALKEPDRALADLDEAVRLDPHEPRFYFARALARSALGDHEEALRDFDQTRR